MSLLKCSVLKLLENKLCIIGGSKINFAKHKFSPHISEYILEVERIALGFLGKGEHSEV